MLTSRDTKSYLQCKLETVKSSMTESVTPEECLSSEITCRKYQRVYWEENMIYHIDYNTKYDLLSIHIGIIIKYYVSLSYCLKENTKLSNKLQTIFHISM